MQRCTAHSAAKRALFADAETPPPAKRLSFAPMPLDPELASLMQEYKKAKDIADQFNEALERSEREHAALEEKKREERRIKYKGTLEAFTMLVDRSDQQCNDLRAALALVKRSIQRLVIIGDTAQATDVLQRHGDDLHRTEKGLAELQKIRADRVRRLKLLEDFIETGCEGLRDALLLEHALSSVQTALYAPKC